MPEVPIKEVRLPELRLPEISREEILRTVSEVRRPELSDLIAHLPGRAPSAEVASSRKAISRILARLAGLAAILPAIELPQVADALSRLVARVRPAPKRTLRDRFGLRAIPTFGRPRVRVVIAALIVAGLAIGLTRMVRAARRRAMAPVAADAEGLEIAPDAGPSGDSAAGASGEPWVDGIAIVEVVEIDAIAEATRITNRPTAEGGRVETAPWEDAGAGDPGSGDGMPVFDETQTTG